MLMNGQYEDKFPQAKAMYLYMMVHPGKKLNFMGNEIGQLREWDEKREQDWEIRKYPIHDSFCLVMKELNHMYEVKVKDAEKIGVLLHTDWNRFGGTTDEEETVITLKDDKLVCKLAPFSGIILKIRK